MMRASSFVATTLLSISTLLAVSQARPISPPPDPLEFSGIYPHLAYFNTHGECGTGAVVPWANRLWVITYAPHQPKGSTDKLYEIDSALNITTRPESVGGTPANRMIHRESNQLFIIATMIVTAVKPLPSSRAWLPLPPTASRQVLCASGARTKGRCSLPDLR